MKRNEKGFTLVELIVVMTIIVIITSVGMVSYATAGSKARDSRRMADLERIRSALEMYRADNKIYPSDETTLGSEYLKSWPKDPKPNNYKYVYNTSNPYSYTLGAHVENLGSTTPISIDSITECSSSSPPPDPSDSNCNYEVTNP